MVDHETLARALTKAGVEKLSPPQRAYLAARLVRQGAAGEITATNLGGLRDVSFGVGKGSLASFSDIDAAARALVLVSARAAPRDWSALDDTGLARLDSLGFSATDLIPGAGLYNAIVGPSDEAEETFRGLVADWEGFDRLGVGERIFYGEKGPDDLKRADLRPDAIDWRKFRDEWKAGTIPGNEVAARLNVQRSNASKVRKYLAEAKVIDPALQDIKYDKPGVDVEHSTAALAKSASVNEGAKSIPIVGWLTNPAQDTVGLFGLPIPSRILWTLGLGLGGLTLLSLMQFRGPSFHTGGK